MYSHSFLNLALAIVAEATENLDDDPREETVLELLPRARQRREHADAYMKLLFRYGGALIGKKKWKTSCLTKSLSEYLTTADEAFLWLCIDTYLPIYNPQNIHDTNREVQQTLMVSNHAMANNKENMVSKTANGNRYGWTTAGIQEYNKYCHEIVHERHEYGKTFDDAFLTHCQEHTSPTKKTVARPRTPPIQAWNCLAL